MDGPVPPLLGYRENWPSALILGPLAGGLAPDSGLSWLRFRLPSGEEGEDRSASRGIGMPLSRDLPGKAEEDSVYGRKDLDLSAMKSVSMNGEHSTSEKKVEKYTETTSWLDAPFSRNSSN